VPCESGYGLRIRKSKNDEQKEKTEYKQCLEELDILDGGQVPVLEILHGDFRRK
jgi:hypothetical protein